MTGQPDEATSPDIPAIWERLNDAFLEIYSEILRHTATVKWHVWAWDNHYHHLSATADFERVGCDDDEDLVLTVSIAKRDGMVHWQTDAAQNRGLVLADGPERLIPDAQPLSSWIGEAADDAIAWFKAETPNFIAYLNREPTPYDVD